MAKKASRVYSDELKAKALVLLETNRGNASLTSRQTGVPRTTLSAWSNEKGVAGVTPELKKQATDEVVSQLDQNIALYLDAARDPEKIKKASLKDVNLSLAINIDKKQLLTNQPTAITQTRSDHERLLGSIRLVIEECSKQGVQISKLEAAMLLRDEMPGDAAMLDNIIEGELVEDKPAGLLAA